MVWPCCHEGDLFTFPQCGHGMHNACYQMSLSNSDNHGGECPICFHGVPPVSLQDTQMSTVEEQEQDGETTGTMPPSPHTPTDLAEQEAPSASAVAPPITPSPGQVQNARSTTAAPRIDLEDTLVADEVEGHVPDGDQQQRTTAAGLGDASEGLRGSLRKTRALTMKQHKLVIQSLNLETSHGSTEAVNQAEGTWHWMMAWQRTSSPLCLQLQALLPMLTIANSALSPVLKISYSPRPARCVAAAVDSSLRKTCGIPTARRHTSARSATRLTR